MGSQEFKVLWEKEILRQRLSKNENDSFYLRNPDFKKAWLVTYTLSDKGLGVFGGNYFFATTSIMPFRNFKKNTKFTIYLLNKRIAKKWLEYSTKGEL